jgi:hypothetical protein
MKPSICLFILSSLLNLLSAREARALDQIIHPYQSVRSEGMGGLTTTTGLYDQNFFGNPARVTANPESRFTFLELTPLDFTPPALSTASSILKGVQVQDAILQKEGQNLHERVQLIFPAYYHAAKEDRKWALAFAIITNTQIDSELRQSYQLDASIYEDVGLSFTFGHKFLKDDPLSVGVTGHLIYRMAITPDYSLLSYASGTPFSLNSFTGDGLMADFDLGATYKIISFSGFDLSVGAAMQNLLGGNYSNIPIHLLTGKTLPPAQARSVGTGVSLSKPNLWVLKDTVFALEFNDILNNGFGSIYRLIHVGAETHFRFLVARLGMSQGYFSAGVGIDTQVFNLDLATYGEEMGLNAGTLEDRRYAVTIGLHI